MQVNGLGRSWQRPPGLAAKLIHSKAANSSTVARSRTDRLLDGRNAAALSHCLLTACCMHAGLYYLEYTLQNPGERRRHIVSAIGMAFNGWYNRLHCDGPGEPRSCYNRLHNY
jgi:hypothetical protein